MVQGQSLLPVPQNRAILPADILHGWAPREPFIHRDTKVLAFGSCFAEYFIKFLTQQGYNRWQLPPEQDGLCEENLLLTLGQTFENIFVILQQFRWAFGEFTPQSKLWFMKDKQYFEASEQRREKIRRSFEEADVFVVTLGLSEIWFDHGAGEPMWRAIPERLYEPGRHVFRRATVAETLAAFYDFAALANRHLAGKRFIFTLSPVPLIATFRDQSPITANCASKAVLRASLDEFLCEDAVRAMERYHYFPSYELVFHLFDHPFLPDNRHVRPEVVSGVLAGPVQPVVHRPARRARSDPCLGYRRHGPRVSCRRIGSAAGGERTGDPGVGHRGPRTAVDY